MIFSNKVNKLASGTNVSFYPTNDKCIEMFVFNKLVSKKNISYLGQNFIRCKDLKIKYSYNQLIKINDTFSAVCFDKNISVIGD